MLKGILAFSVVLELLAAGVAFLQPKLFLSQFDIQPSPETIFLSHIFGWQLLFLTAICLFAYKQITAGSIVGWHLCYVLGVFWIGIGIYLGIFYPQTMFFDSIRGAILLVFAKRSQPPR